MDYLGAVVAIVSLAVAVFVGVQIYQSFNLKNDIDKQNQIFVDRIKKKIPNIEEAKKQLEEQTSNEIKRIREEFWIDISGIVTIMLQLNQHSNDIIKTAFNLYSMDRKNLSKLFSYKLIIEFFNTAKSDDELFYSFINNVGTSDLKKFISEYSNEEDADFELISKLSEHIDNRNNN